MTDAVKIAVIGMLGTAAPSLMSAWFSYRASKHAARAVAVAEHTEENTNHMKDELVALTAKSSHAEGVLEGKKDKEN